MKKVFLVMILFFAAGCENVDRNMHDQISVRVEKAANIPAPAGAVPALGTKMKKDYSSVDGVSLAPPSVLGAEAVSRGQPLYNIYCSPCHGLNGKAETKIAQKMDIPPFDLTRDATKELTDGEIFVKIVASDTTMPKYRNELDDNEAWDVTAYVRSLQRK